MLCYARLSEYNGMAVLSRVLRDGVTPVISYWARSSNSSVSTSNMNHTDIE